MMLVQAERAPEQRRRFLVLVDEFQVFRGVDYNSMLAELRNDNRQLVSNLRETHDLCDEHGDVASTSLLETWIDEAERRAWFLFESTRVRNE